MPSRLRLVLVLTSAVLLLVLGGLWTLQGLGYAGGSADDDGAFATIGPIVAGLGVALAIVGLQRR